ECSAGEWEARVDLAAAHRLAVMHGLSEGIYNHLTQVVVPGKPDRYYQIPFGMHWSEVKASSFMEVGINDAEVKRGTGDVERSCYCIHAPIHKALPQAKVVFHTHMPFASALTRLEDPRIKEIGQTEVGMMEMIAYDDNYTGPAFDAVDGAHSAASKCYRLVCVKARAIQGGEARKRRRRLKFEGIAEAMTTSCRQGRAGLGRTRLARGIFECALLIGTRSAQSIMASGFTAAQNRPDT